MEGKSWQVMHMNVMKGFSAAQSNEHQRNWTERGWDFALEKGRYDRQRERLNFEVVKGGKIQEIDKRQSIPERMAESLLQRGIKDPNEDLAEPKYRTVVDFILSGSQTTIRQLAFGNQDVVYEPGNILENATLKRMPEIEQWAKDMYRFMSERFGEENIIGCYVHLDELSPHMHLTLLPIQDGKFAFKKMFAGKDKLEFSARTKKLHDELAEVNRKWNLKRGRNVSETGAKHRTTEEYRRHLSEECTNIEEQVVQHKKSTVRPKSGNQSGRTQGERLDLNGGQPQKGESGKGIPVVGIGAHTSIPSGRYDCHYSREGSVGKGTGFYPNETGRQAG